MALGAQRSDVVRMVFLSTLFNGCGIVAGVVLSLAMARVVLQWAQGSAISIAVLLGVTALLATVQQSRLPAHRASTVIRCRRCATNSMASLLRRRASVPAQTAGLSFKPRAWPSE